MWRFLFFSDILVITMLAIAFVLRHEIDVYQIPSVMKNRMTQTNTIKVKKKQKRIQFDQLTCTHKCEINWTLAPLSNRPIAQISFLHARTIWKKLQQFCTGFYSGLALVNTFCWWCCCCCRYFGCFTVSNGLDFISYNVDVVVPFVVQNTQHDVSKRDKCRCVCVDEAREHEPNVQPKMCLRRRKRRKK